MDLKGRKIAGRYRAEREIASTWLSSFWTAVDEESGREVRIRAPREEIRAIPGFSEAAEKEIRTLVGERRPGVQVVLGGDGPAAILEAAKGGTLADRLGGKPLEVAAVAGWLSGVASALDRLHQRGIVHREVFPEAIVFDAHQEAWLADPSYAAALGAVAPDCAPDVKTPGELGDLPPETIEKRIGPAFDQYCLAAVVFRSLAGRRLQPSDSYLGAGQALAGSVPVEAVDVLERAISVVPADRYSSCGVFAAAFLDAAGAAPSLGEETGTLMMDVGDLVKPKPRADATSEIPVAAPLPPDEAVSGAFAKAIVTREIAPAPPPPPPPRRRSKAPVALLLLLLLAGGAAAGWYFLRDRSPGREPAPPAGGNGPVEPTPPAVADISVTILRPATGDVVGAGPVRVAGRVYDGTAAWVMVAGVRAVPDAGGAFEAEVRLAAGDGRIEAVPFTAEGIAGRAGRVTVAVDATPPVVEILAPPAGFATRDETVEVRGVVRDERPDRVRIGAREVVPGADGSFAAVVPLADGESRIPVSARDRAGNESAAVEVVVLRDATDPTVRIEAPEAGSVTSSSEILVRGVVADDHPERALVGDREVDASRGTFEARYTVKEGENRIAVAGFDRAGNRGSAEVTVWRDTTPPRVTVLSPANGATVPGPTVAIRGRVEDATPATVTVGGTTVAVGPDGAFEIVVDVKPGDNPFDVIATDRAGYRSAPVGLRLVVPTRRIELRVDPLPGDPGPASSAVVTGTVSPADARVTAGGVPATVSGGRFRAEVPLRAGMNEIAVSAEGPGAVTASATLRLFRGRSGDTLLLATDATVVAGPADAAGTEVVELTAGSLRATIGAATEVQTPAGRVAAGPGQRIAVAVDRQSDRRVEIRVEKGSAVVSRGTDRLLIPEGETVTLEVDPARADYLRFFTGRTNRQTVALLRQPNPQIVIILRIPKGTNGVLMSDDGGRATRIESGSDSAGSILLRTDRGGLAGDEGEIRPGQFGRLPHDR